MAYTARNLFRRLEVVAEGMGRLVSPGASLPGMQMAIFSPCPLMAVSMCVRVLISSFKDTSHNGPGPTQMTSFDLMSRSEVPQFRTSAGNFGDTPLPITAG